MSNVTGAHYDASVVADYWPGVDGGTVIDRAKYAAEIEPFVKETMRVMLEQDPASIASIEKAATDDTALRKIMTVVGDQLVKGGTGN